MRETRAGNLYERKLSQSIASLPELSKRFPPRYDLFGEAQQRFQYGGNSLFNVFINPAAVRIINANPAAMEVLRIAALTGNNGVIPNHAGIGSTERKVKLPGLINPIELTNEQLSQYALFSAQAYWYGVTAVTASPEYAKLPIANKARILSRITQDAGEAAKQQLFRTNRASDAEIMKEIRNTMETKAHQLQTY